MLAIKDSPNEAGIIAALVSAGKVSEEDVTHAQSLKTGDQHSLLVTLNRIGVLQDADLAIAYREMTGFDIVKETELDAVSSEHMQGVNPAFLKQTRSLLLGENGPLAVVDPFDARALNGLEFALGHRPALKIVQAGDWARRFNELFEEALDLQEIGRDEKDSLEAELADQDRDAPIVRRVTAWLSEAADLAASDIHFEIRRNALEIRYRIDGSLKTIAREPKSASASVIARIKVLSELDLGERNKSQDGRATIIVRGRRLDVRVSIIPTIDGESAVIRLLDRPTKLLSIESLGFDADITQTLTRVMAKRNGLFVVAGPTGSGKTTTLYACLEQLKGTGLKVLSVEDPVEYHFDHVNQVQISEREGRSFASVLRSFLRHDPDVILVGEIRDPETAKTAVEAALQGHLVLATLHAIDVARVRTRLLDMGVEAFQLDATLAGSLAQRLVRLLCPDCKTARPPTEAEVQLFETAGHASPLQLFSPKGCPVCKGDGYRGRSVVAEAVVGANNAAPARTLHAQGLQLVSDGQTSLAEIISLDVG